MIGEQAQREGESMPSRARRFPGRTPRIALSLIAVLTLGAVLAAGASAATYNAMSWGAGLEGQLGDGIAFGTLEKNPDGDSDVPVGVCALDSLAQPCPSGPYLSEVATMSAGSDYGLALLSGGSVVAWGGNENGQLGTNDYSGGHDVPARTSLTGGVTEISAGNEHALALLANGTVKSWGDNRGGDLGHGTCCYSSDNPALVSGLTGVTAVSAGYNHSLALLSNGTVEAWGANNVGQLGNGTTTDSDVPVPVSGLGEVVAISAGGWWFGASSYSLALLRNGTVKAWGANNVGELGDGSTTNSSVPVAVSGLSEVTAISAGSGHSLALLSNGTVEAWGHNDSGQLGDGTNKGPDTCEYARVEPPEKTNKYACATTPTAVTGLSDVTAVAAGGEESGAVREDRSAATWGTNAAGGLGIGTFNGPTLCESTPDELTFKEACSTTPVEPEGLTGVRGISVGDGFMLSYGSGPVPRPDPDELLGRKNPGEPNLTRACAGKPVNCYTGNEVVEQTDLALAGRGVPLALVRTYNAQAAVAQSGPGLLGYGWSCSFSDHLSISSTEGVTTVAVVQANGSVVRFTGNGELGSLTAPKWAQAKLVLNADASYTYTLPDQESFHFDSSGRLLSEADRDGNTTTLKRNAEGRVDTITDAAGREMTFAYNPDGLVESVTDPMGHTIKYAYEAGNLASVTLPGESAPRWLFKYDSSHRLTEVTDGRGGVTTNEYDSSNRVISQTDPAKRTLSFAYVPFQTTITNKATGSVTRELFTEGSELEEITRGYGTEAASTERFSYDEAGNLLKSTDGDGHTTDYGYDAQGNRTSAIDADEHETKWTYDSAHDVISTTTPKGETTTIKRDSHGNPEVLERPAPAGKTQTTKYHYNSLGELESITDPLEHTTKYEYDSQGDRTGEIDPEGDKRTWGYDEDSQTISSVSPRGNLEGAEASKYTTKVERDAQGRAILVTDPLGHKTKSAYDADGNLESQTDPNGHKTTYTYDADNERTKVAEPNGTITEAGFDGAGQVVSQTDGNKHTTKYTRNVLEQVTEAIDPLGRKTTKEYDKAGNLTKLTDAAKRTTSNVYDSANLLKETTYSDGKTHSVQYEYDADGDRTKMVDASGTTTDTYDQLDRLTEAKDGHGNVIKYEYDLAGEPTKITYPNGKSVTQAFDTAGRLQKVTDWLEHTTTFAYNPDSDETAATFPTASGNEDKYSYDEADQLSEVKMLKGAEMLASLAYTRDSDGQVKAITSKGLPGEEKPAYEYDSNNRLTKGGASAYEYDAADNPTKTGSSTNTFDSADEIKTGTGVTFAYDELGERTKRTPSSGAAMTYGYNQAGALTSVERPKAGKVAGFTDTYVYDGTGLRASQTLSGSTTFLAWDRSKGLPLLLGDGTNSYVYGPGGLPVEQISSAGTVLYLHHDQQGSTRLLTSTAGKVEATMTYDAYGNTLGTSGSATTPLGYDGQYTSTDSGLVYLRARVYDPSTAQFMSSDPLEAITDEPYAYAGDNPLNDQDRSGLDIEIGPVSIPTPSLEEVATRFVGFWDGFSQPVFGGTAALRSALGLNGGLETCSAEYQTASGIGNLDASLEAGAIGGVIVGNSIRALGFLRLSAVKLAPVIAPITSGIAGGVAQSYVAGNAPSWETVGKGAAGGLTGELSSGLVSGKSAAGMAGAVNTAFGFVW